MVLLNVVVVVVAVVELKQVNVLVDKMVQLVVVHDYLK
jgi:hypothetical protein